MSHRLAVAVLATALAAPLGAQPPETPRQGLYVGPASCAQDLCHGSTAPRRVFDVDQDEYYVWLHQDRHASAFEVLFDERSAAIVRNLAGEGDVPAAPDAPACLACHALAVPEALQAGAGLEPTDGVSCEACHGPASGWRGGHTAEDWTHERSVAAGMIDLRDLSVRAGVCHRCHLGAPGRVVDHDLIAAGHPPLQFELDNFSQAMPAHWRREAVEGVRSWALGQAVGFREGVTELGRRAREGRWPDFSAFSCDACHHEVRELGDARFLRSAGQNAAYRDRIGLPAWSPARWAVLRVLVDRHAPEELAPLDDTVGELARQVSRLATPPGQVAATADALAARLAPVTARLGAARWDPAEARAVALAITGRREVLARADVHTAEQTVQALYTLGGYLLEARPGLTGSGLTTALTRLAGIVEDPAAYDPDRFRDALAAVEAEMR